MLEMRFAFICTSLIVVGKIARVSHTYTGAVAKVQLMD